MILINGRKKQEMFTGQIVNGQNPAIPQIAHYSFDNISGATVADETGSYPGTLINGPQVVAGVLGNGTDFDTASDQYVDCGTTMGTALGSGVSSFSVSLWLKADDPGEAIKGSVFGVSNMAGTNGPFQLRVSGNVLRLQLSGATFNKTYGFTDSSSFHHIVALYNGNKGKLYLDNGIVIDESWTTDLNFTGLITTIGCYVSVDQCFDGKIDQVRIYNGVWTTDQINQLFNEKPEPWIFRNGKAA